MCDVALHILAPPAAVWRARAAAAAAMRAHPFDEDEPARASLKDLVAQTRRGEIPALAVVAAPPCRAKGLIPHVGSEYVWVRRAVARGERLPRGGERRLGLDRARFLPSAPQRLVGLGRVKRMDVEHGEYASGTQLPEDVVEHRERRLAAVAGAPAGLDHAVRVDPIGGERQANCVEAVLDEECDVIRNASVGARQLVRAAVRLKAKPIGSIDVKLLTHNAAVAAVHRLNPQRALAASHSKGLVEERGDGCEGGQPYKTHAARGVGRGARQPASSARQPVVMYERPPVAFLTRDVTRGTTALRRSAISRWWRAPPRPAD